MLLLFGLDDATALKNSNKSSSSKAEVWSDLVENSSSHLNESLCMGRSQKDNVSSSSSSTSSSLWWWLVNLVRSKF